MPWRRKSKALKTSRSTTSPSAWTQQDSMEANNTYQWTDNYSKSMGTHTFKARGGITTSIRSILIPTLPTMARSPLPAQRPDPILPTFSWGSPSTYAQGDSNTFYLRNRYVGLYAQDSWRVRPDLTLNYGLRWDVLPPWREKYNQLQTLFAGSTVAWYIPEHRKDWCFPAIRAFRPRWRPTRHTDFAPRIGSAYSPDFNSGRIGHKVLGGAGTSAVPRRIWTVLTRRLKASPQAS